MNNPTTIYVIRHGESESNVAKKLIIEDFINKKSGGSKLTKNGDTQVKRLADKLKNIDFSAIYSSGLRRSIETATIFKKETGIKVIIDNSVYERTFYYYAHKLGKENVDLSETLLNKTKNLSGEEKMEFKYTKDMESAKEGALRLKNLIDKIAKKYTNKNVLVISHGNLMRSFLTLINFCKYDELPTGSIKNTGFFILETNGKEYKIKETKGINSEQGKLRVW